MKSRRHFLATSLFATGSLFAGRAALAHGEATRSGAGPATVSNEQKDWGVAGDPREASRTVPILITNGMRFSPDRIDVRLGETIRFVHRNVDDVLHEMVIGTKWALHEHAELMTKFPGMEHDAPWMTHVAPGGMSEIIWTFNRLGRFDFACLIPGHYQAGMIGTIIVSHA